VELFPLLVAPDTEITTFSVVAPAQYSSRKMKLMFSAGALRTPEKMLARYFLV